MKKRLKNGTKESWKEQLVKEIISYQKELTKRGYVNQSVDNIY